MLIKEIDINDGEPKICVPIVAHTYEQFIDQFNRVKHHPDADVIECRIDYYEGNVTELLQTLKTSIKPVIFTFRTTNEGGEKPFSDEYLSLNKQAIESGATDLIDIEFNIDKDVKEGLMTLAKQHGVKVIFSHHNFSETPSNESMFRYFEQADQAGADCIKLAVMPRDKNDVFRLMQVTDQAHTVFKQPVITMAMGKLGVVSRFIGAYTGSAITFASLGESSAPGQIHLEALKRLLDELHVHVSDET